MFFKLRDWNVVKSHGIAAQMALFGLLAEYETRTWSAVIERESLYRKPRILIDNPPLPFLYYIIDNFKR